MPVTFLAAHNMSYYYIDFALPGLALAVGTVFEWIADALPDRGRVGFAAGCLILLVALSSYTARQELHVYLEVFADRTGQLIDQAKQDNPHPSKGSTMHRAERRHDVHDTCSLDGDLYRVIFHDPSLKVTFVSPQALPRPAVVPGAVAVIEGDTGTSVAQLPVYLSAPSRTPVTASWLTVNDSAVAPQDYAAASGTVVVPAGADRLRWCR